MVLSSVLFCNITLKYTENRDTWLLLCQKLHRRLKYVLCISKNLKVEGKACFCEALSINSTITYYF